MLSSATLVLSQYGAPLWLPVLKRTFIISVYSLLFFKKYMYFSHSRILIHTIFEFTISKLLIPRYMSRIPGYLSTSPLILLTIDTYSQTITVSSRKYLQFPDISVFIYSPCRGCRCCVTPLHYIDIGKIRQNL